MAQVSLILEAFADSGPPRPFPIEKDGYYAITKCADDVSVDITRCSGWGDLGKPACLALVAIQGSHLTLRSASESCAVVPPGVDLGSPSPSTDDERWTKIALEQSIPGCHYSVILRPDDRIVLWSKAPRLPRDCTLKVQIDNVQVESSLPAGTGQSERKSQYERFGKSESRVPAATPLAASTTSQVVNETPASRRRQQARGDGCTLDREVSTIEDRMNATEEHEGDGDVSTMNDRTNAPKDAPEDHEEEGNTASESENEDETNEEQNPNHPPKPSNPKEETEVYSNNHADSGEAKESMDQDHDVVRHQKRGAPQRAVLSPRVEIPATRGYKREAQKEHSPRATKKQATGGALKEFASDTPPSSNRSSRLAVDDRDEKGESKFLRVAFSNSSVNSRPSTLKFLSRQGVQIQDSVTHGCDYLCVNASGQLIKSFKLLMSVILGKTIISDEWVLKSINAKSLVDPDDFITTNAPSEWQWGNSREEVADALRRDRSRLFEGFDILVTPKLRKEYGEAYKDIEKLLKKSGAATVVSKQARAQDPRSPTVVIGSENEDADVTKLSDSDDRWSCFSKELISMSILRGQLDLESNEFKLRPTKSSKKAAKPGRSKKSK